MSEKIQFFAEGINYRIPQKKVLRFWIKKTIIKEKFLIGNINIVICDENFLFKLNKKFLNKDTLTDIITFPLNEESNVIAGDIYLSLLRVKDNSKKYEKTLFNELSRVIIHGILHLAGYKDKTEREKRNMRKKENDYLEILVQLQKEL